MKGIKKASTTNFGVNHKQGTAGATRVSPNVNLALNHVVNDGDFGRKQPLTTIAAQLAHQTVRLLIQAEPGAVDEYLGRGKHIANADFFERMRLRVGNEVTNCVSVTGQTGLSATWTKPRKDDWQSDTYVPTEMTVIMERFLTRPHIWPSGVSAGHTTPQWVLCN